MARVYAVANQKGGTGKTTTTVNLAAACAALGYRTLLIDLDPQANATYALTEQLLFPITSYQVMTDDIALLGAIHHSRTPNFDFVASDIDLAAAEIELTPAIGSQTILATKLQQEALRYRYVFIDCPPSLGLLTINALAAAHEVIIPVSASAFALKGLERLLDTITKVRTRLGRSDLAIGGVALTFWDRTNVARDVHHILQRHFGDLLFRSLVPKTVKLEEANARHQTIFEYAPSSSGAEAYRCLAEELLTRAVGRLSHNQIAVAT
ncbi:MAG: AAA family ATPase [Chloroflexi bacterium]|nr:AAA family ATPase [Chloroflexota bacterium]